ncbi:MAG: 6,7-dimethyl-8-ribityllumazine synthase [Elusimicrobia bacterium]|nr:6,7-dimethyl-8-ribityllumazine synthase [Elusimicrobiota bacterium]MBD3412045.1 6,7-dimethyl-8-ribityllumazine synthase [Elusimicrobiota bacterium]
MTQVLQGTLIAQGMKFAIVVSRFNEFVSNRLLAGAVDTLVRHEADEKNIHVVWVPGSFELPYVAKKLADKKIYDAILCLGAVIKGETPHNEYIASEVAKGIAHSAMESGQPIIFGVLTTDNLEQAIERAGAKTGNKGSEAARAAIEMANLFKTI